jgi:hypothetical protein
MSLDFQQVRQQVKALGEGAPLRAQNLQKLRREAFERLNASADTLIELRRKVQHVVQNYDPNLRCAMPLDLEGRSPEPLNAHISAPALVSRTTILAADGSQIIPDRHAPVNYGLINVGAIQVNQGGAGAPLLSIQSHLFDEDKLYTQTGLITEAHLALLRDLFERQRLAELAEQAEQPVVSFTDGPIELWGAKDGDDSSGFKENLDVYLEALKRLNKLQAVTAGYVDKPAANLVVRLLEVAGLDQDELPQVRKKFPLRGVRDIDLFWSLLGPGERSAVFALQSGSCRHYKDNLALHFFYLNVGSEKHPWLARVEIPAWVAGKPDQLDLLQAVLLNQCQIMGSRPYPYLLHRAHETALVTLEEKEQVTQMILKELRERGVDVGELSHKQSAKDLPGRTSYVR